ncbi:hypothetical protein [Capsulimonas corticalis]|nr:hypothetical protein [Capsulimonas corticalis]
MSPAAESLKHKLELLSTEDRADLITFLIQSLDNSVGSDWADDRRGELPRRARQEESEFREIGL